MKKPYIKKAGIFSGFNVWTVNGKYVRENLDKDFNNFGQHHDFGFIPKDEFWLDREHNSNEQRFFVENMLAENKFISDGKGYEKARELADEKEEKERAKLKIIKKALKKISHGEKIINKIHKKLLKKYSNERIKVWIVRGDLVRSLFFIDFTEGGNDQIYHFIPYGEIWLDDDLNPGERNFVLLHEIYERNLMKKGIPYWSSKNSLKTAHGSANKVEFLCRANPKMLDGKIRHELNIFK